MRTFVVCCLSLVFVTCLAADSALIRAWEKTDPHLIQEAREDHPALFGEVFEVRIESRLPVYSILLLSFSPELVLAVSNGSARGMYMPERDYLLAPVGFPIPRGGLDVVATDFFVGRLSFLSSQDNAEALYRAARAFATLRAANITLKVAGVVGFAVMAFRAAGYAREGGVPPFSLSSGFWMSAAMGAGSLVVANGLSLFIDQVLLRKLSFEPYDRLFTVSGGEE